MKKLITKRVLNPFTDTDFIFRFVKVFLFLILFLPISLAARDDSSKVQKLKDSSASSLTSVEQILKVTGFVTDGNTGEPMPGVTVQVEGTTIGITTDASGKYSIDLPSEKGALKFSFVGYTSQRIEVNGKSSIDIKLMPEDKSLDEVIVIGYGTAKKSDIVGSVSSVRASELANTNTASSVATMLQGKAAGLVINTTSAQPGGGFSFNIRGLASTGIGNDPLVIIDGYPISNSNVDPVADARYNTGYKNTSLTSINPDDIESIEVLKDASATAIYGARAGHGVILITTKRGISGKTQVEYSGSYTTQKLMGKPQMLNGPDYMDQTNRFLYENWMSQNKVFPYGTNMISEIATPFTPRYTADQIANANTTNWYDLIIRTGIIQQHNLSVRGGNATTKYLISFNSYDNDGIIRKNSFSRYTGRFNLDQNFGKYITGGVSFTMSSITNHNFANNSTGELSDRGIITNALWFSPVLSVKDASGNYQLNPNYPNMPNPVSLLEITDITKTNRYLANSYLQIEPVKGLTVKATLGFDSQNGQGRAYIPTTVLYGAQQGGRADRSLQNTFSWQYDFTVNYSKIFAEAHNITLLLGYSQQEFQNDYFSAGNAQFITDTYLYNNLEQGVLTRPYVSSSASKNSIAGYFGRLMYNFKNKYYFTATLRRDGSSDFAANHKWGNFPSFAGAWRVDQESFMKPIDLISNLKIRLSWGQTGNAGLGGRALSYYGNSGSYILGAGGGKVLNGIRLIQLANPDLKWETTTETNFGIDLGFLKNRITLNVDAYHRVISDLLSTRTLPGYLELSSVAANIGKTQSDGMEFTLNTVNISNPDYSWNTTFTLSYYYDRWKERDPSWVPGAWESVNDPIRMNTGYLNDGLINIGDNSPWILNPLPGSTKTRDIDGFQRDANGNILYDAIGRGLKTGVPDGKTDDADVRIRFVDKPYFIGFNNKFQYKIFDLTIYFYGILHRIGSDPNQMTSGSSLTTESINSQEAVKNAWTHDNPNGSPWSQLNAFSRKLGFAGVQNMAFMRVKDINFGINASKKILPKFVESLRAYVAVSNLWVFTKYTGWDPETDYDTGAYPNPRNFTIGINAGF